MCKNTLRPTSILRPVVFLIAAIFYNEPLPVTSPLWLFTRYLIYCIFSGMTQTLWLFSTCPMVSKGLCHCNLYNQNAVKVQRRMRNTLQQSFPCSLKNGAYCQKHLVKSSRPCAMESQLSVFPSRWSYWWVTSLHWLRVPVCEITLWFAW